MKNLFIFAVLNFTCLFLPTCKAYAQQKPDTVKVGIYITSIHDIDFKQQEYVTTFWLWLKYKNKDFDFMQNLEVPQAKSVSRSFATIDSSNNQVYLLMKMQCLMKDSWRIRNFPFDKQKLRLSLENSQFDSKSLVFVADTVGENYDPRFTLSGWTINNCVISIGIKKYETNFGDPTLTVPHSEYSSFKVVLNISRDASGLFWKMFLGMYIAFLIAYLCFYIDPDEMGSRFGLSVGALFAVIGNKYIIDSSLPETTSFTLVDTLHGVTLFFIFAIVAATSYSLRLVKQNKEVKARRFDMITAQALLLVYVLLNIYFITQANG
ncbi:MAG: hypothetical protein ACTHK0_06945 [Ginsengibacter sp.]